MQALVRHPGWYCSTRRHRAGPAQRSIDVDERAEAVWAAHRRFTHSHSLIQNLLESRINPESIEVNDGIFMVPHRMAINRAATAGGSLWQTTSARSALSQCVFLCEATSANLCEFFGRGKVIH